MKVTVCFGAVRVLVPCGAGALLVRDLVHEATLRYKKATGQGPETWVSVRAIRASSGGILDPDDRVCDVADDRETLTAECVPPGPPSRAPPADGASGSSAGTASPDMFRGGSMRVPPTESCVEVGVAELEDGVSGLQVRRGSEPTLHQDTLPPQITVSEQTKRWSAAVVCREDSRLAHKVHPLNDGRLPEGNAERSPTHHVPHQYIQNPQQLHHFQRHSNRLSMQFSGPGSGVWLDAADRIQSYGSKSLPRDARKEPLGQDTNGNNHRVEDMLRWVTGVNNVTNVNPVQERPLDLIPGVGNERAISSVEVPVSPSSKPVGCTRSIPVALVKGEKGLGFTITTRDNPTGGHCPIYIKNILPKGAAVSDGRLRAGDKLVSVNGVSVAGLTQQQVVALLRNTPTESTVEIVVERIVPNRTQRVEPQESPKKYTEKQIGSTNCVITNSNEQAKSPENGRVSSIVNAINHHSSNSTNSSIRGRISKSSSKDNLINKDNGTDTTIQDVLNASCNSILGLRNRLILRLDVPVHDSEKAGLGISVKGKVTVGPDPQDLGIFIKSVLHGGAASRDGRLHTNDQLLSVNGVSLVGQSNAEAMETLRRALLHSRPHVQGNISLTIARRTESMDSLARWKDDTPPSGTDSSNNSNENSNSQNFTNTVIYNPNSVHTRDKSVASESSYSHTAHQRDKSYDNHDNRNSKKHSSIVTINNNTSWVSNQSDDSKGYLERDKDTVPHDNKRDSFEWSRLDGWNPVIDRLTGLRNESYYMATQVDGPKTNGHRDLRSTIGPMQRSTPPHHNVIIEEDCGTTRGSNSGTSGAPWESGSECGDGAFSRDAVGRRSMSEKRHAAVDAKTTGTYKKIKELKAAHAMQVGPSLGMRKSSSLESLQTAMQENQRNPGHEPLYARAHPPLKHWLTDGNHGPEAIVRGSPQQSSLSHKKPSLLKSLSTMFRLGKPHKKPEPELYERTMPARSSAKFVSQDQPEHYSSADKGSFRKMTATEKYTHMSMPQHSQQNSRDRWTEDKADERRVHPAIPHHARQMPDCAWSSPSQYVNYKEIQHNLNVRREKLSEVQIGQMRRQVSAQRAKAEEESRRAGTAGVVQAASSQATRQCREGARPQSNYYEYESVPPRRPGKLSHYH